MVSRAVDRFAFGLDVPLGAWEAAQGVDQCAIQVNQQMAEAAEHVGPQSE
jgi:hypothetical protein